MASKAKSLVVRTQKERVVEKKTNRGQNKDGFGRSPLFTILIITYYYLLFYFYSMLNTFTHPAVVRTLGFDGVCGCSVLSSPCSLNGEGLEGGGGWWWW